MLRLPRQADGARLTGFDAQFFLLLAEDPLIGDATAEALDAPALRGTRIGYPLLAWLLSPLVGGAAHALLVLQALCALVLVSVTQLAAHRQGLNPGLCLAVPLVLPFLLSLELATAELPTAAMVVVAAEALRRGRPALSAGTVALACLTKEVAVLALLAFAASSLAGRLYSRAALFLAAGLPLVAWSVYLRLHLQPDQAGSLLQNVSLPGQGAVAALSAHLAAVLSSGLGAKPVGLLAALVWYLAGVCIAAVLALRRNTSPGSVLMGLGGLVVLSLAYGPPAYAFDEVFNFGRQLFVLPLGALLVVHHDRTLPPPPVRRALVLWIVAGSVLGLGWWLQEALSGRLAA